MPNTIADNLQRLQAARTSIASAIADMGGTVTQGAGLEDFPAAIMGIPSGAEIYELTTSSGASSNLYTTYHNGKLYIFGTPTFSATSESFYFPIPLATIGVETELKGEGYVETAETRHFRKVYLTPISESVTLPSSYTGLAFVIGVFTPTT